MRTFSLSLRGNRIRSLCGIERLLSLEKLDLQDNEIEDAGELVRLAFLPHLTDLWIGHGNPFVHNGTSRHGDGWRIRFFNNILASSDHGHFRNVQDLPSVDGTRPSWLESRYLKPRQEDRHLSNHPLSVVSPSLSPAKSNSRRLEVGNKRVHKEQTKSRVNPSMTFIQQGNAGETSHQVDVRTPAAPAPRSVRKKHKRIIKFEDGPENSVVTDSSASHARFASAPV